MSNVRSQASPIFLSLVSMICKHQNHVQATSSAHGTSKPAAGSGVVVFCTRLVLIRYRVDEENLLARRDVPIEFVAPKT